MRNRLDLLSTQRRRRTPVSVISRLNAITIGRVRRAPAVHTTPPDPPIQPTPAMACDPLTPDAVLWAIARERPDLRRWIVANPHADAELLEYVSQRGGPHVRESLSVLLDSLEQRTR